MIWNVRIKIDTISSVTNGHTYITNVHTQRNTTHTLGDNVEYKYFLKKW